MNDASTLRPELKIIADWIKPGSRVLDLGCGEGNLLAYLDEHHDVSGYGLEIDPANVVSCVRKGVNVIQANLDEGLTGFEADSFDYVVMTQALQAMNYPDKIMDEMLRVGKTAIVTFPNFGHWRCRFDLTRGRMPVTKTLPNTWYNTPNIHLCTLLDFEDFCMQRDYHILQRTVADHAHRSNALMKILPNLFGEVAIYHLQKK